MEYTDSFAWWFTGLVDGEGCFHARTHIRKSDRAHVLAVYFSIKMRVDDLPMLVHIQSQLGTGKIYRHSEKLSKYEQADFRIAHRKILAKVIVPHFDKYPLQSKKQNDYNLWRKILLDYKLAPRRHTQSGQRSLAEKRWSEVCILVDQLKKARLPDGA